MRNTTIKGFLYAALSSSTFGLAPFFSISLLIAGFSSFEVLTYRWGIEFDPEELAAASSLCRGYTEYRFTGKGYGLFEEYGTCVYGGVWSGGKG